MELLWKSPKFWSKLKILAWVTKNAIMHFIWFLILQSKIKLLVVNLSFSLKRKLRNDKKYTKLQKLAELVTQLDNI